MDESVFFKQLNQYSELTNSFLRKIYSAKEYKYIKKIMEAEEYSLMAGGKRIRPAIVLSFCRMFGGNDEAALPYAAALEMVHTASLIHDDLPCMDNDVLRRGKPTNHIIYGEAVAMLAGDGLISDAFGIIAKNTYVSPELNLQAVALLSESSGKYGIVSGQYIDILGETTSLDLDTLKNMYYYKTGALIRSSAIMGSIAAGIERDDPRINDAIEYANSIGLVFQIIDDILDVIGNDKKLGKNSGRDKKKNKTTYLSFYTIEEARQHALNITKNAINAISSYEKNEFLIELANFLLYRNY